MYFSSRAGHFLDRNRTKSPYDPRLPTLHRPILEQFCSISSAKKAVLLIRVTEALFAFESLFEKSHILAASYMPTRSSRGVKLPISVMGS